MDFFNYKNRTAYCEDVPLTQIAEQVGTPVFVYSKATLTRHCEKLLEAFSKYDTLACFAVKANGNIAFLKSIFQCGLGADIVSLGEMERALKAGLNPQKIVFSGVGKQEFEIARALQAGILSFNVESAFELDLLSQVAKNAGKKASISLRINPDIDAKTNPKISTGLHTTKFGVTEDEAKSLFKRISSDPNLDLVGIACHIGSQITELSPLKDAAMRMANLGQQLLRDGFKLKLINMGGGLGIRYHDEVPPALEEYASTLIRAVSQTKLRLVIEPGRVVAGNSGILLTKVLGVKATAKKNFIIVDASMTELVRPAFYGAYHDILPVKSSESAIFQNFEVVGPVCESSDVLGEDRKLPLMKSSDLLYIRGCGAYGASMSSNYNSRPRASEVLIDGDKIRVVRERETLDHLWQLEKF